MAALLYECGDYQGEGREILEMYTKDVNGHFAEYAHHILTRTTPVKRALSDLDTTAFYSRLSRQNKVVSEAMKLETSSDNAKVSLKTSKDKVSGKTGTKSWASEEAWNRMKPDTSGSLLSWIQIEMGK